jgi:hypothetical protein
MRGRLVWGVALIASGAFFLAQQFGWFGPLQVPFWAVAFGLLGLIFLASFITDRRQWWGLIPGCTLLGLALVMVNSENHFISGEQAGGLFLFCIGLPFLLIYLIDRRMWWALIPGGVLSILAVIAFVSSVVPGQIVAAIFFFGLAAVFAALRLVMRRSPWMGWATWVAIILAAIGALLLVTGPVATAVVGPVILIGLGLILLARAYARRR